MSVVVITRNRRERLVRTLSHLTDLPERPPVVVVDNASDDGTPDVVRARFPHVRVGALPANHGALARTVGVRAATTPYVAFSDDDSWWAAGALLRAADHFDAAPGWACSRRGSSSSPAARSTRSVRRWPPAPWPRHRTCPARRCSASSPAGPWSAAGRSCRWAASTR